MKKTRIRKQIIGDMSLDEGVWRGDSVTQLACGPNYDYIYHGNITKHCAAETDSMEPERQMIILSIVPLIHSFLLQHSSLIPSCSR